MEKENKSNYYVCYNTSTEDYEGDQRIFDSEADEKNKRNLNSGDPRRWIIDKEINQSPFDN